MRELNPLSSYFIGCIFLTLAVVDESLESRALWVLIAALNFLDGFVLKKRMSKISSDATSLSLK